MTIVIKKAGPQDVPLIVEVYRVDGELEAFPNLETDLHKEVTDSKRIVWVATDGNKGVGTVALILDNWQKDLADGETIAMVKRLRVREDYRGQGVSRMLNDALEDEARKLGFQRLSIEVLESNTHAKNIYEHWGYEFLRLGYRVGELALTKSL